MNDIDISDDDDFDAEPVFLKPMGRVEFWKRTPNSEILPDIMP